ncbi:SGNH/GDSL hydrolase family protein [Amycolatopsis nigrescens]|uniref:SGNH/GDSL hydrolase family protein n=1 Tax=Amycolatopsis nigrescens TaxID=381445 RepID=UPI000A04D64E|nr:SGNH/GDSL hydrolase family protein [Amycolatopsis nigrescens]
MKRTAAFVMALTMGTAVLAGTAAAEPLRYEHYVALGDSYTAGPLVPWPRLDKLLCFASTNSYPAWLADSLDVGEYTDASCSSADTTNMTGPQPVPTASFALGSAAPQFDALTPETDLVTVGIGGNDSGVFGELVGTCPELTAENPVGSPCRDLYTVDGVDTMKQRLTLTRARVTEVLRGIHERSPAAKVLLVGYPRIAPPSGYCPDVLPFADGDLRWLDSVEQALNAALADAAAADGDTTFVDTYGPSLGHDACATGGAAWIQGKDLDLFGAAPYHPRKAGMTGVAGLIQLELTGRSAIPGRQAPASTATEPTADPAKVAELLRG